MYKLGIEGYATKDFSHYELKEAIYKVYKGEKFFPQSILVSDVVPDEARQDDIISLLGEGWTIKKIARFIRLDEYRADYIIKTLRKYLHVKNNCELVARSFQKLRRQ